jgi:PAS domain S-box-containing protein
VNDSDINYQAMVHNAFFGICRTNAEGAYCIVNPAFSRIFGYLSPQEMMTRVQSVTDHPYVDPGTGREIQRCLNDERDLADFEVECYHQDGHRIWIRIFMSPVRDAKGRVQYFEGAAIDISEQKYQAQELQNRITKLDRYFLMHPDMLCIIDSNGSFRRLNISWERTVGYTGEELRAQRLLDYIHPEDVPKTCAAMVDPGGTYEVIRYMNRFRSKNGSYRWIEWQSAQCGNLMYASGRDITGRKEAGDLLRKANQHLNLLTSITRHDILNKLTILLGYQDLSQELTKDPIMLDFIQQERDATLAIKQQIEFTRVFQEIGTMEPQWLNLDASLPRSQIPAHITLHVSPYGVDLYADPMLPKVFSNLFESSILQGKTVSRIKVECFRTGEGLTITWEDDGKGIPDDAKESIFDFSDKNTRGLGFFIAKEILAVTGITIRENGIAGKGTRFEISVAPGTFRFINTVHE